MVADYQKSWRDGLWFWMQIPAAEVARGLRESISAYDSAMFDDFVFCSICFVLHTYGVLWIRPVFPTIPTFLLSRSLEAFVKTRFFIFLMKNALWGHIAFPWRSAISGRKIMFSHFFFLTLSGDFHKNTFFHFFDEESVLVTCGVLCPCYRGKTRSGPNGAHRGSQRPVWLHRAPGNSHFDFFCHDSCGRVVRFRDKTPFLDGFLGAAGLTVF